MSEAIATTTLPLPPAPSDGCEACGATTVAMVYSGKRLYCVDCFNFAAEPVTPGERLARG